MELAVVGDCAVPDQQVRLKLHFEDATILSTQQIHEGLCDSWFLLARHGLHSIADLASHIMIVFGLGSSCPHGISLRMESFTLPPSQPVGLLKDKDIVSVNKKGAPPCTAHQLGGNAYSSSFDTFEKITPLGVKRPALEEFEKETGGYESEDEEEKDCSKNLLKDGDSKALNPGSIKSHEKQRAQKKVDRKSNVTHDQVKHADILHEDLEKDKNCDVPKESKTKSREKKRKREKVERVEEQGLEVVPYIGGTMNKKEKEKNVKKQRREDQQVESEKLQGTAKCQTSREGQNSDGSKEARIKGKRKDKSILNKGDDPLKKHSAEKQMVVFGSKDLSLPRSDSSSGEEVKHIKKMPGPHLDNETVKKCSRSTMRKKAKRRWKRENPEYSIKTSREGDHPIKEDECGMGHVRLSIPTKHDDDGDAEEERLPRVVRPGHIRFQDSDKDDNDSLDPQHKPAPDFRWSNGISKRKGQSWGQEKAKRGNNNFQATNDMEVDDIQELEPETLPTVEDTPQIGDVIAYRILELTSSRCPELSEYHVGRVLDLESQSGTLKLADVPKYRTCICDDQDPSFYKDGVLETEISSLAEVRLVERSKPDSTVQASTEITANDIEIDLHITADTTTDISKKCIVDLNSTEADQQTEKGAIAPSEGWQEICDAFQRKRNELGLQLKATAGEVAKYQSDQDPWNEHQPEAQVTADNTIARDNEHQPEAQVTADNTIARDNEELEKKQEIASTESPQLENPRFDSGSLSGGKRSSNGVNGGRARGWHRRAGGLGSTMALLRSQNLTATE